LVKENPLIILDFSDGIMMLKFRCHLIVAGFKLTGVEESEFPLFYHSFGNIIISMVEN
jgi:hypothetical protein